MAIAQFLADGPLHSVPHTVKRKYDGSTAKKSPMTGLNAQPIRAASSQTPKRLLSRTPGDLMVVSTLALAQAPSKAPSIWAPRTAILS